MVPILHCAKGFHPLDTLGSGNCRPLLISLRSIKSPLAVFCDCRPANLIDQEPHSKSQSIKSPITKDILLSSSSIQRKRKRLLGRLLPQNIFCKEVSPRLGTSIRRIAVSVFRCALDFVASQPHHILRYDSPIALYPQACECVSLLDYYTLQTVYILLASTSPTAMTSKDFESPSLSELLYYLGEPHHDRVF